MKLCSANSTVFSPSTIITEMAVRDTTLNGHTEARVKFSE